MERLAHAIFKLKYLIFNSPNTKAYKRMNKQQQQEDEIKQRNDSIYLKATIKFEQPLTDFFYYLNGDKSYLVGKVLTKVMVFNTITKTKQFVDVATSDFVLNHELPPYIFVIMRDRWIDAYQVGEKGKGVQLVANVRISKMEPRTIARYNKGYFVGGYNRSSLPGNRRTNKRSIYFFSQLKVKGKNKPQEQIFLKDSDNPVSLIQTQTPYMLVYCNPFAYILGITSRQILISFQKDIINLTLIQGRYAVSNINGIGIGSKNMLFSFDIQRFPMFGIQITDHKDAICEYFCMQKTGRIFCSQGNTIYEYMIKKRQNRIIVQYPQHQYVVGMNCTSNNNLMILKNQNKMLTLDVFVIQ